MRLDGIDRTRATGGVRGSARPGAPGAAGFAALLGGAAQAAPATQAGSVASLGALLAAQEVDDPAGRAARGRRRAQDLLAELDGLQRDLLGEGVPDTRLRRLSDRLARAREAVDDPHLATLLDHIELRAAVELAKLEMAAGTR